MTALLILSAILALAVLGVTGSGAFSFLLGAAFFACGLPFVLLLSLIGHAVSHAQDRADYRQAMAEIKAEELADEHEFAEDARLDRLVGAIKRNKKPSVTVDNRQVHIHGRDA